VHVEVAGRRRGSNLKRQVLVNGGAIFMTAAIPMMTTESPSEVTVIPSEVIVIGLATKARKRKIL